MMMEQQHLKRHPEMKFITIFVFCIVFWGTGIFQSTVERGLAIEFRVLDELLKVINIDQ